MCWKCDSALFFYLDSPLIQDTPNNSGLFSYIALVKFHVHPLRLYLFPIHCTVAGCSSFVHFSFCPIVSVFGRWSRHSVLEIFVYILAFHFDAFSCLHPVDIYWIDCLPLSHNNNTTESTALISFISLISSNAILFAFPFV